MLTNELSKLIQESWQHFVDYKSIEGNKAVAGSIPILWFGDMEQYQKSDIKIVTVAINPSLKEFCNDSEGDFSSKLRFEKASHLVENKELTEDDVKLYYDAMNAYYTSNPYFKWFENIEKVLNSLNASYYPLGNEHCLLTSNDLKKPVRHAIHIDIYSPIATDPTWADLKKSGAAKILLQTLDESFFSRLIKELKPDIILTSTDQDVTEKKFMVSKDDANQEVSLNISNQKYLRLFEKTDMGVIIWGAGTNGAFKGLKDEEMREGMNRIIKRLNETQFPTL